MSTAERFYVGVDVGTGSVRAGVFNAKGEKLGRGSQDLLLFRPAEDFVEQSSDDIFRAAGEAVREALSASGVRPEHIAGLSFDATCSLVVLGAEDRPLSVSPSGNDAQNVIVWMDHRATEQAARINATGHPVLRYVGGSISPEMECPKLLWLKEHLLHTWQKATRFLDLADFLTYRATGVDTRSLCTTVCKWTYLGHDGGRWEDSFFQQIGLGELVNEGYARIGRRVAPMGERVGTLTPRAAAELGLLPHTAVGVGIIDAHAGGLGLLGASNGNEPLALDNLEQRLALIGGTSSCHMAASREPKFVPGIWGPYFSAMIPGLWLTEGGQSATGALIDHCIFSHARARELEHQAKETGSSVYALLNTRLSALAQAQPFPAALTRDLHVLPDHHGNRSPRADPSLRGMVSGLKLTDSIDSLAVLYLATVQAIAHGTRHIVDTLNGHGYQIRTLFACGGDTQNPIFLREHADISGCRILVPSEREAVLLGTAILAAVAAGDFPDVISAMQSMSGGGTLVEPDPRTAAYHAQKYKVFLRMYDDQMAYRKLMA